MSEQPYDVIIVGGASAGLTSALYTSRQGLKTMVLTKDIGGQALLTNDIQNYPGFPTVGGLELTQKFEEQAKLFGTQFSLTRLWNFGRGMIAQARAMQ
jgi:thioredoxin reductase (NADPH)